jgi:hypothetical protein
MDETDRPECWLEFLEGYYKRAGLHRIGDFVREHARDADRAQ